MYGVSEKRDADNEPTGLPDSFPGIGDASPAVEQQRLEHMLQTGISPRMPGISPHAVPLVGGSCVLVVHIPRSWAGPHMICYQDWNRFYSRNSSGKCLLDVGELRAAFLRSADASERIRQFHADRLGRITAADTPVPLSEGPVLVLHLMPLGALGGESHLDVTSLEREGCIPLPLGMGTSGHRYNLDGLVTFADAPGHGGSLAYVQLYRNGIVEAASTLGFHPQRKLVRSRNYEEYLLRGVRGYLDLYKQSGVNPPLAAMVSLVGVQGYTMDVGREYSQPDFQGIDRDVVIAPDALIEDLSVDPSQALRPCFDAIWNACGYPRSLNYDEHGNWRAHS